jgi:hypothetical protein
MTFISLLNISRGTLKLAEELLIWLCCQIMSPQLYLNTSVIFLISFDQNWGRQTIYSVSCDFISVLQDLIPEVIPSQECHMNRFSAVTELRIKIKGDLNDTRCDYRCTSSMTGNHTCQSTRDGVPERALPWLVDWSWWSEKLAPTVTGPHSSRVTWCMNANVNRKEELQHRIFDAARCMNDPDFLRKFHTILNNFKYP